MRRTVIEFHGANCVWCLNRMLTDLSSHGSVVSARFQAGSGCIEVDHDAADFDDVLEAVQAELRGWHQAENGERVMVELDVHPASVCPLRRIDS